MALAVNVRGQWERRSCLLGCLVHSLAGAIVWSRYCRRKHVQRNGGSWTAVRSASRPCISGSRALKVQWLSSKRLAGSEQRRRENISDFFF